MRIKLIALALLTTAVGRAQTDTAQHVLRGVQVTAQRSRSGLFSDRAGGLHVNMDFLQGMPRLVTGADPMRYAQTLPMVQTNADFEAGLHIQGFASGQSAVTIGQAVVYNPSHLLGLFSPFVTTHYHNFSVATHTDVNECNRLGGVMRMHSPNIPPDSLNAEFELGLIAAQGTVRIPLRENEGLTISARRSFLNLLYASWIKLDDVSLGYGLTDANLTYQNDRGRTRVELNAYYGGDKALTDGLEGMNLDVSWHNYLFAAEFKTDMERRGVRQQGFSLTGYQSRTRLNITSTDGYSRSSIHTLRYNISRDWMMDVNTRLRYGFHLQHHIVQPQVAEMDVSYDVTNKPVARQQATEANVYVEAAINLPRNLTLTPAFKGTFYRQWRDNALTCLYPDVSLTLTHETETGGRLALNVARTHQYLHHTGYSSMGLPIEFYYAANKLWAPSEAIGGSLTWSKTMASGRYKFVAEVHAHRMLRQVENKSDILELLNTGYDLDGSLLSCKGYNYGFGLQLIKQTGRLTGWVSYALTKAPRLIEGWGDNSYHPARHERPHELNVVASWRAGKRWSASATFVLATGTPFTPIRQLFVLQNWMVCEYAPYNSGRLKPYLRLDLCATYQFKPKKHRQSSLTFSVFNATMANNEVCYTLKFYKDHVSYRSASLVMPILPSISYTLKLH